MPHNNIHFVTLDVTTLLSIKKHPLVHIPVFYQYRQFNLENKELLHPSTRLSVIQDTIHFQQTLYHYAEKGLFPISLN